MQKALPHLKFIYIRRRDRLRQAISKARALQSDMWRSDAPAAPAGEPEFDAGLISHCILDVTREEEIWSDFFARNGIEPFRLEYEDFARHYERSLAAALDFLSIRLPHSVKLTPPRTERQADAISAEWEARYKALSAKRSELLSYV
ncbi:MAG: hypothetical protein H0X73_08045 [Chthoniobacterales bacterium]|nr:hypothetical protein [Chthoniobacterales bacterium]